MRQFKAGDKVTVGAGKTVWVVLAIAGHGETAHIASGKRTTMERVDRLRSAERRAEVRS